MCSKFIGFILKFIARDLYKQKETSLQELKEISKENGSDWTVKQTNDNLSLLNKNIINLNCSTSVYSRVLTILTFVITLLTIIMLIK